MDGDGRNGQTRTDTEERIRERVAALEAERDQFALGAPIRAEERMNALRAQLQMEIDMRMGYYHQQIADLSGLLPEVKEAE